MCLTVVEGRRKGPETVEDVFKVFRIGLTGQLEFPLRTSLRAIKDTWLHAEKDLNIDAPKMEYEPGFHGFVTEEGAQRYAKGFTGKTIVLPVKFAGIQVYGRQADSQAVVAASMYIRGDKHGQGA